MLSTIGLIVDIAIILALVIFGIIGFKNGLLKSFLSLFNWVACIIVACLVAKYVAGWINGIYNFSGLIGGKISSALSGVHEFFGRSVSAFEGKQNIINSIPTNINGLLQQLTKVVFSNSKVNPESSETVAAIMGTSLGHISMVIISGILVFIVLKIALALLSKLFDNIARTKVLGGINKILGLVFGLLKAGVVIVALNFVLVGLTMIPAVNNTITPIVQDNTKIEKFVYNKTDDTFGKYVIEGDAIQNWITSLWEKR